MDLQALQVHDYIGIWTFRVKHLYSSSLAVLIRTVYVLLENRHFPTFPVYFQTCLWLLYKLQSYTEKD